MKKFLINVFIFVLVFSILTFLLGEIQVSDNYVIYKTKSTSYMKIAWDLNLINKHPERIKGSTVFLGPSLIQQGVCDSTLNANGIKAVNMGVNHSGNELELFFLNKISGLQPKKVFFHLSKEKEKDLHSMTPLLFTPHYLLASGQSVNAPFFLYLFKRAGFVLDYLIWSCTPQMMNNSSYPTYGVVYAQSHFSDQVYKRFKKSDLQTQFDYSTIHLKGFRTPSERLSTGVKMRLKLAARHLNFFYWNLEFLQNTNSQQAFLNNAISYSFKKNIMASELYMPTLMDARLGAKFDPACYRQRSTFNPCSVSEFGFLDSNLLWSDIGHLSKTGAIQFTRRLLTGSTIK